MGSSASVQNAGGPQMIDNKQDFTFDVGDIAEQENENIQNKYKFIHPPLGRGFYGEVYKVKHKRTGVYRSVKRIRKYKLKSYEQTYFEEQTHQLKKLDHPNILKLYEFYQTQSDFYIVSELCTGGELLDRMSEYNKFSEYKAAELMVQILRPLQYCHKQNNILFASRLPHCCVKLTDFGILKDYATLGVGSQKFGTPYYIAPELLTERPDYKADIWACGVILYMMISGQLPFYGKSDEEVLLKIVEAKYDIDTKHFSQASDEVKDLITKMLEPKKSQRYSTRDCLNHPWFYKFASKEVEVVVLKKAFKNIRGYAVSSKLQQVIWIHMISMFTSSQQIEELLEVFKSLDSDDDGCLTRLELKSGFMRIGSAEDAEQSVLRLQQILQKPTMTFSEFLRCSIHPATIIVESNIEKMFRMFDEDENTTISISQLHKIMGNNKVISVHLLQDFMKQADADSDGTISFEEFKKLLEGLLSLRKQPYHDHAEAQEQFDSSH